ncbi:MAG: hypothetical protein IJK18_08660 [Clostridia bacterium]|nr:hypothetical protein [Clostridia bacterium]
MDSNIRICSRKFEGEITDEEKNRLIFLAKQYHRNIERLEINKRTISFKSKFFPPIILIMFLFSLTSIAVFVYLYIKSLIFQLIIGFPAIIVNGYAYLIFYINYLFQEKEEEKNINDNINKTLEEINFILDKYKITKEDFYKEYTIN